LTTNTNITTYKKIDCHKGNTKIYTEPNGGTLFIGGWSNGASFDWNTHVIDLTGNEHKYWDIPIAFDEVSQAFMPYLAQSYAGWLSLPFPDFGTPKGLTTKTQWEGITSTIRGILKEGKDVLVACHGGHGRSGLFCAIVGYLLNSPENRNWKSPVDQLRSIHCSEAVETLAQERYVYDILGLKIQITHSYAKDDDWGVWGSYANTYMPCPICKTQSMFVIDTGMCLGCKTKYENLAPTRENLTLKDIDKGGLVEHVCTNANCMGIWKASKCGHVTHNMVVYEGWCQSCAEKIEEEQQYAEKNLTKEEPLQSCAICGENTMHAKRFGVCYACSEKAVTAGTVDMVHNSMTDPYRAVVHICDDIRCIGIVCADQCGHVVHNQEIEDGACPHCLSLTKTEAS
jgi:hypothetical protein